MDVNEYIRILTKPIGNANVRREISQEYEAHMEDQTQAFMADGMSETEARQKALEQMGDPEEAGGQMGHLYRTPWDWKMFLYTVLSGSVIFGVLFAYKLASGAVLGYDDIAVPTGGNQVLICIGAFLLIFGLIWSAVEKYRDYDTFYAVGQNWRGNFFSNSGLMISASACFICRTWVHLIAYLLLFGGIQLLQRSWIAKLRDRRESELLWEMGTAETEITYKGTATIKGQSMKVRTKQQMRIPKGDLVMITTLDGFKPYVISVTGSETVIEGSKPTYPDWQADQRRIKEERKAMAVPKASK